MRRTFCTIAVAITAILGGSSLGGSPAKADIVWTLTNVALDDGGVLNGSFTIDVYGFFADFNLTTTAGSGAVGGYNYTPVINGSIDGTKTVVTFNRTGYFGFLQLDFANPLTVAAATDAIVGGIGGPSYECAGWSCGGYPVRYVGTDGFASTATGGVPELATWAMMIVGFGGVALQMRRRDGAISLTA